MLSPIEFSKCFVSPEHYENQGQNGNSTMEEFGGFCTLETTLDTICNNPTQFSMIRVN